MTTKPARQRTVTPSRHAPTYPAVPADRYAHLDEDEKRRHDLHVDIDIIVTALRYARLDRDSHGFPTGKGDGRGGTESSTVETVAFTPEPASAWLAEYAETRAHIVRLANLARVHYGIDPGRRHDDLPGRPCAVEVCVWCDQPAPAGRDLAGRVTVRRVDGLPVHATPCYWDASHQARKTGQSVANIITTKKAS